MEAQKTSPQRLEGEPKILFRSGPLRGSVVALEKERVSIGRDERNDISIRDDIVSSFHAGIVHDLDGYWLEDMGSKNGTFLNGERIERARLKDGDTFCLCKTGLEIQFTLGEPALPTLIESTTATFARTKSFGRALEELLPRSATALLGLTGVRKVLHYKLEESTRRARVAFLAAACGFAALTVFLVVWAVHHGIRAPGGDGDADLATVRPARIPVGLDVTLDPIYGSLFLSYRDRPIGEVVVLQTGETPLEGLALSFRFELDAARFLVEPWSVPVPPIPAGGSVRISIAPKLSTDVLSDRTREVTATVTLSQDGRTVEELSRAIFVHDRNVFTWEVPERAVVFVDQNDVAVRELVKQVWDHRPHSSRMEFPPPNVVGAVTLLGGLRGLGLRYLPDAANPLSEKIDNRANDRVNYPGQTIVGGTGDCDDLTVLCCAALEAVRIPTAMVVGAGHVLLLFDTGLDATSLGQTPFDPETVVLWKEKVWMPIEATDLTTPGASFATAWAGAWSRLEAISNGEMVIVETRDAWKRHQPMTLPPDDAVRRGLDSIARVRVGLSDRISRDLESLRKLLRENLSRRIGDIEQRHEPGSEREQEIGLLYAQSGLFAEARQVFERAIFGEKGPPEAKALGGWASKVTEDVAILLANLSLCLTLGARSHEELDAAAGYGELAIQSLPGGAEREKGELMLRLALVHHLRGDLSAERSWSSKAFYLDPGLEATYRRLMSDEGPVAGTGDELRQFLRKGLRYRASD
ncbi:MAG TPA: FHA domain-containing protein [Planctomycetota bacterium]|nr:FHA domain-containing protein [Planctomycetota bacterium]